MTTNPISTTATALPLAPGHWTLDPYHSSVGFTIRHLGISKVRGRFGQLEAELSVGATTEECTVTASIAMDSIDTGRSDRDKHVLAADMLDVRSRPTMAFRSTRIRRDGTDWVMEGELTIGGVSRPVMFDVDFGGVAPPEAFDGHRHAGFEATGEIRRSEFGLGFGAGDALLGDVVKIQLDVQFVESE
ncbi:MAG: hypothetical protein GEU98_24085 [Pseudonocardiaceae bacterium]|nr:hypothetical protein [Pseudonocardiaceae bacterium]